MSGDNSKNCSLLLPPGASVATEEIADALQENLGLHRSEAMTRARYGGGVLAGREDRRELEKLAAALRSLGTPSSIVRSEDLENLPRARRTIGLEFAGEELIAASPGGDKTPLEKASLGGIRAFALLPETPPGDEENTVGTPLRASLLEVPGEYRQRGEFRHRLQRLVDHLQEPELNGISFQFHIYSGNPLAALRIQKDDFNYSCLGENKSDNSLENYIRLLEKLLDWFPDSCDQGQVADFLEEMDPRATLLSGENEAACSDRSYLWHLKRGTGEGLPRDPGNASTEQGS